MTRSVDVYKWVSNKDGNGGPKFYGHRKVFECRGKFHKFGIDYEEFDNGAVNFSTAIVELNNGEVRNIPVELIKFDTIPITVEEEEPEHPFIRIPNTEA